MAWRELAAGAEGDEGNEGGGYRTVSQTLCPDCGGSQEGFLSSKMTLLSLGFRTIGMLVPT